MVATLVADGSDCEGDLFYLSRNGRLKFGATF